MRGKPHQFFVSPDGNDAWSGQLPEPNADRSDGPFATLEQAQHALRQLKTDPERALNGLLVGLRGGSYRMPATLKLDTADSGAEHQPVVWAAFPGEKVTLTNSREVFHWKKISDPEILERLSPAAQKNTVVIELKPTGISELREITPRGGPDLQLYFRGAQMSRSRWPKTGWLKISDVPQTGETCFHEGLEREKRFDGVPVGRHFGRVRFDAHPPHFWAPQNEIYLHGYWTWDWSDSYQQVAKIDWEKSEITIAEPHHHYGYTKNQRFYFLNLLEEIDAPGAWCLDREKQQIYFWPPETLQPGDLEIACDAQPLIELEDCEFIHFYQINFARSGGTGVKILGGTGNLVAGCNFQFLGQDAVVIDGGQDNGVLSCDISHVAMKGIVLNGGDRQTLRPAGNYSENNHIQHFSEWINTYQSAVEISGVGNFIVNNLIHDAPHEAILLRGNDHLIEFNEIHNIMKETGDSGAIHTGRDVTWRGNVIRHNYFHHLQGPGLHGVVAIYLDDFSCGFTVFGNICYQAGRGTLVGGGRDNLIQNNVYIDCEPAVHLDARGLSWASYYFDGTYTVLEDLLRQVPFDQPAWTAAYPELATWFDGEPAVPKNNVFINNIAVGGRWMDIYDYFLIPRSALQVRDNYIAAPIICRRLLQPPEKWDPYYLDINMLAGYGAFRAGDPEIAADFSQNEITTTDPGFVDLARADFRLREDAPVLRLGFEPIPVEKIGLFRDDIRTE